MALLAVDTRISVEINSAPRAPSPVSDPRRVVTSLKALSEKKEAAAGDAVLSCTECVRALFAVIARSWRRALFAASARPWRVLYSQRVRGLGVDSTPFFGAVQYIRIQ